MDIANAPNNHISLRSEPLNATQSAVKRVDCLQFGGWNMSEFLVPCCSERVVLGRDFLFLAQQHVLYDAAGNLFDVIHRNGECPQKYFKVFVQRTLLAQDVNTGHGDEVRRVQQIDVGFECLQQDLPTMRQQVEFMAFHQEIGADLEWKEYVQIKGQHLKAQQFGADHRVLIVLELRVMVLLDFGEKAVDR